MREADDGENDLGSAGWWILPGAVLGLFTLVGIVTEVAAMIG